jgi:hypothetical protein
LIATYELTTSTTDKRLKLHPFPTLSLRGLLGECIYRYSRSSGSDLYRRFFKPTRPPNQLKTLRRLVLPKPYVILPPQQLHSERLLMRLRVFGHPNHYMGEVLRALSTAPCRLRLESAAVVDESSQIRIALTDGSRPAIHTTLHSLMDRASSLISSRDSIHLTLDFLTPFLITREGEPVTADRIRPSDIVRYSARRLFILDSLYYSRGRELPFPLTPATVSQLKDWADNNVRMTAHLSTVKGFHRRPLLTGKITTQIPATEQGAKTLFLLLTGQYLGLGKWTAYGMGQYQIQIEAHT